MSGTKVAKRDGMKHAGTLSRPFVILFLAAQSLACSGNVLPESDADRPDEEKTISGGTGGHDTKTSTASTGTGARSSGGAATGGAGSSQPGSDPEVTASPGGAGGQSGTFGDGDLTVLLVLDKSGSMSDPWDGGSKWQTALSAFFNGMKGVEDVLTVGALLFPQGPSECEVDPIEAPSQFVFQNGTSFLSEWHDQSDGIFPGGSTPLGSAFEQADAAISQAAEAGLLEERRFRVLVVTDGQPNCGTDPDRLLFLADSWRDLGVEVHVMGLPGSEEAAQLLRALAQSGGTDEYIAPETGGDAEDTFYEAVR